MPDMDEPVNVEMEPEEALRLLLGEERRQREEGEDTADTEDE
jgi:hypothetical protein